jgi:DNA-binding NarL/FixJ family response regulator
MITIGIIEDDDKIRREFQEYFAQSDRFKCVIAAGSVEKFQKYYRSDDAGVPLRLLMLDINLPGMSGLDAIESLKRMLPPDADIIMFTSFNEPNTIFKALCAGATGYLLKNQSLQSIENQMVQCIEEGGCALSPSIARRIVHFFNPSKPVQKTSEEVDLRPLERQVAHFLMQGKTYEEIAASMSLTVAGVKYHQKKIFQKLHISSRHEIAKVYLWDK